MHTRRLDGAFAHRAPVCIFHNQHKIILYCDPLSSKQVSYQYTHYVESVTSLLDMEQMEFITEHFGIKRYRSVAAVCAIYPDAHTVETHLYLKLTSFCVHILIIVPFRVLILVKLTFWTAISAHQVIISVSVWYGKYTTHWLKT